MCSGESHGTVAGCAVCAVVRARDTSILAVSGGSGCRLEVHTVHDSGSLDRHAELVSSVELKRIRLYISVSH